MKPFKKTAVIGLGLIGGSLAKTIKRYSDSRVIGFDIQDEVLHKAVSDNTIDIIGTENLLGECDLILIALYPKQTVDWIAQNLRFLKAGCIITDLCGVKESVCAEAQRIVSKSGVHFVGGHPMAGREFSGYNYAVDTLFDNASMILVPTEASDDDDINRLREFFMTLKFGQVVVTDAQNHDRMIAFTSQLAHVVSNAYVKSPEAVRHSGYSAGSYRDLTRVARLNEQMWTELFLSNRSALLNELDGIITRLTEYRDALKDENAVLLQQLLRDGSERKKSIDNNKKECI